MAGGGSLAAGQSGARPNHRKRKAPVPAATAAEDEADSEAQELRREVEELEEELANLDRRVLEHVRGTATRLADAAVSRLAALRPATRLELPTGSETSVDGEDEEQLNKLNIIKSKIEANIADLPKVLEKVNESVARCDKLDTLAVNIPPVFRRKLL